MPLSCRDRNETRMKWFVNLLLVLLLSLTVAACNQEAAVEAAPVLAEPESKPQVKVNVIHHAVIYTVNPDQPVVEAMAFTDEGEILQLGTNQKIQSAYQEADSRDLEGKTVIPGLMGMQ